MIINSITYRWVNFSDSQANTNNIVITDVNKTVNLRTQIYPRQNYHWTNSSFTLAEWRLFTFTWQIFWATKTERQNWQTRLWNIIKPEWLPDSTNDWFYELTWKDDWGTQYKLDAKVYKMPEYSNWLNDPVIKFTFELYSEKSWYKWYTDQSFSSWAETERWDSTISRWDSNWTWWWVWSVIYWFFGWITLWTILWTTLWSSSWNYWESLITNSWNFIAPVKIQLIWSIQNPRIHNLTNSRSYRLTWITTTNLIIDNRERPFVVTNDGIDISSYRQAWSKSIVLEPWSNTILVTWDDFVPDSPLELTLSYNYAYIQS